MRTAARRRTALVIAASAMAHLGVLGLALTWRAQLSVQDWAPDGAPAAIIPVRLAPRRANVASIAPPRLADRAPLPRRDGPERSPAAIPSPPASALPRASETPSGRVAESSPAPAGPAAADLRDALRHGLAGCANAAAIGMARAEREPCEARLAAGAASAPTLALALEPRLRAYYDAVAKAKAPDGQMVPLRAPGALGFFEADKRNVTGHPPIVGCMVQWGPGEKRKIPAHWLKLGPCFIAPPQGPLTVEADITPP